MVTVAMPLKMVELAVQGQHSLSGETWLSSLVVVEVAIQPMSGTWHATNDTTLTDLTLWI
jgi:hypothetical protein